MKRQLINYLGLLGPVSFLSYLVAMVFSPLAYPGYNWMAQAVSDLSAIDSPARHLWHQLAILYTAGGIVNITLVSVFIDHRLTGSIRSGIHLFALMNWLSTVGYAIFPLSSSGFNATLQDILHTYVITSLVVVLSIASLSLIIIGGLRRRQFISLSYWAFSCLLFMLLGAIGTGVVPSAYFGIPERFSVLSVTLFNAVLGMYLYKGFEFHNHRLVTPGEL